jgi:hypothetical protein
MNAVKKLQNFGISAVVAAAAFSLFTLTANAQQPPAAAPAAPAVKPAAAPPAAPAAKATPAPAAAKAPAATTPAAKPATTAKTPVVVCKGLDQAACKANTACDYIEPKDANNKTGKVQAPYCRKVAGVAAKKPAATTAPAAAKPAATAAPAVAKPAAAAPVVTTTKPAAAVAPKQ